MGSSFLPSVTLNQWKSFVRGGLVTVVRIAPVRRTWVKGSNPGGTGRIKGCGRNQKEGSQCLDLDSSSVKTGKGRLETCLTEIVRF